MTLAELLVKKEIHSAELQPEVPGRAAGAPRGAPLLAECLHDVSMQFLEWAGGENRGRYPPTVYISIPTCLVS